MSNFNERMGGLESYRIEIAIGNLLNIVCVNFMFMRTDIFANFY